MKKLLLSLLGLGLVATTCLTHRAFAQEQVLPIVTFDSAPVVDVSAPLVLTPEEEEAWKKEPYYGKEINIGYNGGLCLGTFGIAQAKGFYEEEGLKTKILAVDGIIDGLGTNKIQAGGNHIAAMVVPAVNGVRMKFTTGIHTGCKSIYVPVNSDIKTTADLKGKTVAVSTGIGNSDHNISLRFLNHDNIRPEEVKFKNIAGDAVVQAMERDEVQAACMSDQFAFWFVKEGKLRVLRSLTFDDDFKQEACCIHAVNLDFYNQNPITVKKMTHAHERASAWIMANLDEALDIMYANDWASGDRDIAAYALSTYNFNISDEKTEATLRSVLDDYKTFGIIDSTKDTDELLNKIWDPVLAH